MCTNQYVIYERTERISTFIMKDVTMVNVELATIVRKNSKFVSFFVFCPIEGQLVHR